jgi:hypothetical protein
MGSERERLRLRFSFFAQFSLAGCYGGKIASWAFGCSDDLRQ